MRIADVGLTTDHLDRATRFYEAVLGLPVTTVPGAAHVRIGTSTLTLVPGPTGPGVHHLAFDVPRDRFADAKAWLTERVELIALDGADEFAGPGSWNSQSVYFIGPDGVVLELIARHERATDSSGQEFSSADLLNVSEIGIAVPDVPAATEHLRRTFAVAPFGSGSDTFAPVGDHDGLLIIVAAGRVWFPTDSARCQGGPTTVTLAGVALGTWSPPGIDCVVTGG